MFKKILFTVHDFHPLVGGSGEVVYQLARRFAAAGCDTTVATGYVAERDFDQIEGIKICDFKIGGNKVKGYKGSASEIQRYIGFVTKSDFNVIINYAAQSWCSDLCFENIEKIKSRKILVPCGYTLKDPRYHFYFRWLPKILKKYDYLIYLSNTYQDIKYHRKHNLKNEIVIPNGADEDEFLTPANVDVRKKYGLKTKYLALCVSNYFFLKGQDFVVRAFNKLKRNDVTLIFISQQKNRAYFNLLKLLARNNKKIIFLEGIPRGEVVDFFKQANFFLFGSRLECSPLVMFESFSSRTLFITRGVGNTEEYKRYNVIVNSPAEMAAAIERGLNDEEFYRRTVSRAHKKYLRDHTYRVIFEKYRRLTKTPS